MKYLNLEVQIHGLSITDEESAILFLKGWIKEATKAALLGNNRDLFNFRNEFEDDIIVKVEESA